MSRLSEQETPRIGQALASQVADRLEADVPLVYYHRDYCGMGLAVDQGKYIYDMCYDGWSPVAATGAMSAPDRREFASREAFVEWLAQQSDDSLSGRTLEDPFLRGNQRVTIARLREFCAADEG